MWFLRKIKPILWVNRASNTILRRAGVERELLKTTRKRE